MQDEQIKPVDVIEKNLVFKEYSSLEISTRDKFISKIRSLHYDDKDILWVASEKIHGCNFSIHYNGQFVRYGRRTDFLTKDIPVPCEDPGKFFNETFYDAKNLVKKFHNSLEEVYKSIKSFDQKLLKFSIYGEYFGGCWPIDKPYQVAGKKEGSGQKMVQKGIYYTPNNQFYAFDIFVTNSQSAYWVDVEDIPKLLKDNIHSVPIYAKGTFDEVFNVNIEIDSTIPELLGFAKLDKNIIEGMVIRPNKNLATPDYKERVIIKKKNREFLQKVSEPNPNKKQKKEKTLDPQIAAFLEQLLKYVNVNRINSAVSKFPDLKDRNKLKEIVSKDVLTDAEKDEVKLPAEEQKLKKVIQELNNAIIKQINSYFIKH